MNKPCVNIFYIIYCVSVKTPVDHFHLVVSDSKKGRASGKSFVEIVSYEVGSPDRDIQIYNLTALRCFLTISANYEVFLGGYYFDMDNTENQGESCLVISHGASAESKKHKLCEAKQEGSIKHVILPCENQERRAEITFTGPNTTRFNLPILGKESSNILNLLYCRYSDFSFEVNLQFGILYHIRIEHPFTP